MNIVKEKLLKLKDVPKFCEIRIESTNYCGCRCFMCPIDQMTRKKGYMSIDDLKIILNELKTIDYDISFQLHGHGESLLCNDLDKRIKIIKESNNHFLPQITTTLAYNIDKSWFFNLFENGLNEIFISLYGYDNKTYKKVHGVDKFDLVKENLKILSEVKQKYQNVIIRIQLDDFKELYPFDISEKELSDLRNKFIKYLYTLNFDKNEIIFWTLHNYGNSLKNMPQTKNIYPCSILWGTRKNILQIDWQLNVIPCCFDFDSKYIWGNLKKQNLKQIFNSKNRMKFLDKIDQGNKVDLCKGCPTNKEIPDERIKKILMHPICSIFNG